MVDGIIRYHQHLMRGLTYFEDAEILPIGNWRWPELALELRCEQWSDESCQRSECRRFPAAELFPERSAGQFL
jgi:hypothetical protein